MSVSMSGHPRQFLAIIIAAHNCAQRMRPQATGSNSLSGIITCPSVHPPSCLQAFLRFLIFINYQFWGPSCRNAFIMNDDSTYDNSKNFILNKTAMNSIKTLNINI